MNMSKKSVSTFIVGMMMVQTIAVSPAFSQAPPTPSQKVVDQVPSNIPAASVLAVTGGGQGGSFIGAPGAYNMSNITQNNSDVMKQVLADYRITRQQDRDYLNNVLAQFNKQIKELNELSQKFIQLSFKSKQANIDLNEYMDLVNQIRSKNSALINDIQSQAIITPDMLPPSDPAQAGGMNSSVASSGNINITKFMVRIEAVRQQMIKDIDGLSFGTIIGNNKAPMDPAKFKNALNPDLSGLATLSPKQIEEMGKEIMLNYAPSAKTKRLLQSSIETIVGDVQVFVQQFGAKQFLTFDSIINSGDHDVSVQEAIQNLTNNFFQRSYMRKTFKQRMGTFNVEEYQMGILRSDVFRKQPINYVTSLFKNQMVIDGGDVTTAFNNARLWFRTLDQKSSSVFQSAEDMLKREGKDDKYASKDTGLFIRMNTLITKASGQQEVAEVMRMMVQFLLADIREEQMAVRGDWEEVAKYHDMRFRATPEMREMTNKKMCEMDWTQPAIVYSPNGPCGKLKVRQPSQPTQIGNTATGIFSDILFQVTTVEKAKHKLADNMKLQIQLSEEAGMSKADKDQRDQDALDKYN